MKFEEALAAMREGKKIRREGWCDDEYIVLSTLHNKKTYPVMDERQNAIRELGTINLFQDDWQIVD